MKNNTDTLTEKEKMAFEPLLCSRACYNCGNPLELDFYWIVNRNGNQMLGVDIDLDREGDEWIEFEICNYCHASH